MKRLTMGIVSVVLSVLGLACLSGCDLLNQLAPVPPIESFSDRELAEELWGRGVEELEGLLGSIFDDENALKSRPRATSPSGRARSIRD